MTYRIVLLSLFGAPAFVAGCVQASQPSNESVQQDLRCKDWGCGYNSPVVDTDKGFHELNLAGLPNAANLSLHNPPLLLAGQRYQLATTNNQFVGWRWDWNLTPTVKSGQDLLGAEILIDTPDLQPAYAIVIKSVRTMKFPFHVIDPLNNFKFPRRPDELEVYELGWRNLAPGAPSPAHDNLCSSPPYHLANDPNSFNELLGMNPHEALIFVGDRVDVASKTMSSEADPTWFNIGCAGDTLPKLHLTRNTLASATWLAPAVKHSKRQATLKLLAADYCGTGRAFTVPWQPLDWKGHSDDAVSEFFKNPPLVGIEARWDEYGATCLSKPRMQISTLDSAKDLFPDPSALRAEIDAECERAGRQPLPPCDPEDPEALEDGLRVSAHPDQASATDPQVVDGSSVFRPLTPSSLERTLRPLW